MAVRVNETTQQYIQHEVSFKTVQSSRKSTYKRRPNKNGFKSKNKKFLLYTNTNNLEQRTKNELTQAIQTALNNPTLRFDTVEQLQEYAQNQNNLDQPTKDYIKRQALQHFGAKRVEQYFDMLENGAMFDHSAGIKMYWEQIKNTLDLSALTTLELTNTNIKRLSALINAANTKHTNVNNACAPGKALFRHLGLKTEPMMKLVQDNFIQAREYDWQGRGYHRNPDTDEWVYKSARKGATAAYYVPPKVQHLFNKIREITYQYPRMIKYNGRKPTIIEMIVSIDKLNVNFNELELFRFTHPASYQHVINNLDENNQYVNKFMLTSTGRRKGLSDSILNLPKSMRDRIFTDYDKFDMSNAQITLLDQLTEQKYPTIHKIATDKHTMRNQIAQEAGITETDAKTAIMMLMFGSGTTTRSAISEYIGTQATDKLQHSHTFMLLVNEREHAANEFARGMAYRGPKHERVRHLARSLQSIEAMIMEAVVHEFHARTMIHDCLMIDKDKQVTPQQLTDFVREQFGVTIEFDCE